MNLRRVGCSFGCFIKIAARSQKVAKRRAMHEGYAGN